MHQAICLKQSLHVQRQAEHQRSCAGCWVLRVCGLAVSWLLSQFGRDHTSLCGLHTSCRLGQDTSQEQTSHFCLPITLKLSPGLCCLALDLQHGLTSGLTWYSYLKGVLRSTFFFFFFKGANKYLVDIV